MRCVQGLRDRLKVDHAESSALDNEDETGRAYFLSNRPPSHLTTKCDLTRMLSGKNSKRREEFGDPHPPLSITNPYCYEYLQR